VVAFCSVATTSFWCETSFRDFGRYRSTQGVDSVAELIVNEIECDNRLGGASTILIYCIRMQALVRVRRRCQNGYSMIIAEALGFGGLPKNLLSQLTKSAPRDYAGVHSAPFIFQTRM
jgi:hypothetical protein